MSGEKVFDKYVPESGETFWAFGIEGCHSKVSTKCPVALRCEIQSPKTEAVEKECVFNKESGSKLNSGATKLIS